MSLVELGPIEVVGATVDASKDGDLDLWSLVTDAGRRALLASQTHYSNHIRFMALFLG